MQRFYKPLPTLDSQNARNLYADIAWFGVLSGISGSFLSVFVLRAGGSDFHVGLLSALPALVTFLASIPGSRLVEHENKPLSVLIVTAVLSRLGYLAIALSPFFLTANRADVIVAIVGLMTVPTAVFNVAFTTMFGQAVKPHDRAKSSASATCGSGLPVPRSRLSAANSWITSCFPSTIRFSL